MSFETTRDLLQGAQQLHQKLSRYYQKVSKKTDKERIKMLLEYLSRHERRLADSVKKYTDGAADNVLQTWYQYAPRKNLDDLLKDIEITPDMPIDEVLRSVIAFDDALIALYQELAQHAGSPTVRDVFTNLLEMEKSEKLRSVRDALMLNDL